MWSSKDITIEKKKVPCMVNESDNMIEIEMPFDLKLRKATSVTIDSTDYKITSMEDVGERKETLKITIEVQSNDKSIKGRKDSKLSE